MSDNATGSTERFVQHPNTRTLHRGSREGGAECGQPSDSWAELEAENPLDAVLTYGGSACTKCFRRAAGLRRVDLKEHSSHRIHADLSDIVDRLPWSLHTGTKQTGKES